MLFDVLFDEVTRPDMLSTPWGYAQTYSILLRRRNGGVLDKASFTAVAALQDEIIDDEDFRLLSVDDA